MKCLFTVLGGISLYNISIADFLIPFFFIILWILMRKPHLKRSLPPILTPPQNLELPLFTNKQTVFLNFDTCKSFVLWYLVNDDHMGKNHYPKHWKTLDFLFSSKSYFFKYIILEGL